MQWSRGPACLLASVLLLAQPGLATPTETILYAYPSGLIGGGPTGLTADAWGNFYTPLSGLGLFGGVGRLVRPHVAGQNWRPQALYNFQETDGAVPVGTALVGKGLNLFVTTFSGGVANLGAVLELSPPAKGTNFWTRTVLYSFPVGPGGLGLTGAEPMAGLIQDHRGNLFTTTSAGGQKGGGAVIELSPPAHAGAAWTEHPIYNFRGHAVDGAGPETTPVADQAGNLYVTTSGGGAGFAGTVVKLAPPSGGHTTWTETILHTFSGADGYLPNTSPTLDPAGNIYVGTFQGGTRNLGTIVGLTPPPAGKIAWARHVLYNFGQSGTSDGAAPDAILRDAKGNLFVTTDLGGANGKGTLIKLSPPADGKSAWAETILYSFGPYPDAANPRGGLLTDASGNLYTATTEGGPKQFFGTIVKFSGTGFAVSGVAVTK